jgi:hypothetical protein
MDTSTVDPIAFLKQCRDLFNARNYEALMPFLHKDIDWMNLHHPGGKHGNTVTIQWLGTDKSAQQPQFLPDMEKVKVLRDNANPGIMDITGTGTWISTKAIGESEQLSYRFTLVQEGDAWLLRVIHGTILHP